MNTNHSLLLLLRMLLLQVTYEEALAAVFVEAWIFIFISLIGLRGRLIELVPKHIMLATAVGIGKGVSCS
jgi:AGZA family xanthine/uracil permease-like MFS transporter